MPQGVVGFVSNGNLGAEIYMGESRRHGEQLAQTIRQVLEQSHKNFSDLDGIIIGTGPGSFVGVRVAMSTGKGIGLARRVPVWGVSTLSALAFQAREPTMTKIVSLIDARRAQGYVQSFDFSGDEVECDTPHAIDPDRLPTYCAHAHRVAGNGLFLLEGVADIEGHQQEYKGPSALGLWSAFKERCRHGLVDDEIHHLVPEYIRPPDAKRPKVAPDYSLTSS